ncbi:MAG: hypothetical protein RBR77_09955 [Thauera sp.]|jgi:hypothetical protein|nr:hypothetical protein [Thauera sp.]
MTPEQITSLLKLAADLPDLSYETNGKAALFCWQVASAIYLHDQESAVALASRRWK